MSISWFCQFLFTKAGTENIIPSVSRKHSQHSANLSLKYQGKCCVPVGRMTFTLCDFPRDFIKKKVFIREEVLIFGDLNDEILLYNFRDPSILYKNLSSSSF